jgi:hypothetical protein
MIPPTHTKVMYTPLERGRVRLHLQTSGHPQLDFLHGLVYRHRIYAYK